MKNIKNLTTVAVVVLVASIVFAIKHHARLSEPAPIANSESSRVPASETTNAPAALPHLVDLGADKCIPCKMMAPILEDLKTNYAGQLRVDFIDVWKNPEAGDAYDVRAIPLQIFFNAEGRELFRHEGFYPKEDILAKWRDLGYDFK